MPNATIVNFAGGETSPKSRGRFDIASYNSSCRKLVNFIAEVSGPARFRPGFKHVKNTKGSAVARLVPFQLNDSQSYLLEFTSGKMRVYKDGELALTGRTTLTAATKASTCVITVASTTNLANGDDIVLYDVVGMTELNGRTFRLAGKDGSTYQLTDPATGTVIDSTDYGTWASGGTVYEVYEVATPYLTDDLPYIQYTQTSSVMYIAHYKYAPRKLTVDSAEVWTLATYSRTNDPFATGAALTVQGVAGPGSATPYNGYVAFPLGSLINESTIYTFAGITGTTELNSGQYFLRIKSQFRPPENPATNVLAYLINPTTGGYVNVSSWTPWTSGGTATPAADNPISDSFYENRMVFAGTNLRPATLLFSMAPDSSGALRPDTFTGGTDVDDACFFSLAPVNGSVPYIVWSGGTSRYFLVGTFGGVFRVSGGGVEEPITPSSINVKQLDAFGCDAVSPAINGGQIFFIQRGGKTLRGIRYDVAADDFASMDMCINADQIGVSPLSRCVLQTNFPDVVWVVREDGILCGMTVQNSERIAGWHRHIIGGTDVKVIDAVSLPRAGDSDQLYIVSERTVNGVTRRSVEVMTDDVAFPDIEDFYSGSTNKTDDRDNYRAAVYRRQEQYIHMDAAASYDGSDAGAAAGATLTPASKEVGAGVVFTASAAVFATTDVGKELWRKPDAVTGLGAGRAVISSYGNTTQVTCEITEEFDSTDAIPAGDWYFAVTEISGIWHLEGEVVAVVADGAVIADGYSPSRANPPYAVHTVADGKITLDDPAAVVHVGLPYEGLLQTHNLEIGGRTGPAQTKPRNIVEFGIRFLNSLGCQYGTDLYNTEEVVHRDNTMSMDRPVPVFSGIRKLPYSDTWSSVDSGGEKCLVIAQRLPLPCTVQFVDIQFETGDE